MKKFIKKLIFLLPIPITLILTNYFVDPGKIFYKHGFYEKGIVKILSNGENVENLSNYDERLLQKFYIDKLKEKKNLVVLGSSRAMQINSNITGERDMFNSSVSGASLQDLMAIYGIYREKNLAPKKIILGLDPWILNKNNNQIRWKSIQEDYFYIQNKIKNESGKTEKFDEKYLELVSLSYFQSAVDILGKDENVGYKSTKLDASKTNVKRKDGSLSYSEKVRNESKEEVRKKALEYVSKDYIYCLENFKEMDREYKTQFEKFINLIQGDGAEVVFFLSPYYPYVYNKISTSSEYKIVDDVEKYFRKFSKDKNIKVYGSYNPQNANCNEEDFYDGMHIKPSGVKKMLKIN